MCFEKHLLDIIEKEIDHVVTIVIARERATLWNRENRERYNKICRNYRMRNMMEMRKYDNDYYYKNIEKIKQQHKEYYNRKKMSNDG
jgi:hypothetical protein